MFKFFELFFLSAVGEWVVVLAGNVHTFDMKKIHLKISFTVRKNHPLFKNDSSSIKWMPENTSIENTA